MILLTNIESIPGKRIVEHYGVVNGSSVRAKNVGRDIAASFKNLVGGRVTQYEPLVDRARREASLRMREQARQMGADLIMNVRLDTSFLGDMHSRKKGSNSIESIAYGTAIRYKR